MRNKLLLKLCQNLLIINIVVVFSFDLKKNTLFLFMEMFVAHLIGSQMKMFFIFMVKKTTTTMLVRL